LPFYSLLDQIGRWINGAFIKYTRTSFREGLIHVRPDPAFTSLFTTSPP
jgi:hypothetical protein